MSLFVGAEYCSKIAFILQLIKHDHIEDNWRSWLLLISWVGYATLACVASVSNRVIIVRELKEMNTRGNTCYAGLPWGLEERRWGWGRRERRFLSLRSIPFWFPASLFSPETPDTQPNVTSAMSVCELCDNLYRGSFLRIWTSSLRSAFFSKTMIVSWTFERLDLKKASKWVLQAEKKRREKTGRKGGDMREIWEN